MGDENKIKETNRYKILKAKVAASIFQSLVLDTKDEAKKIRKDTMFIIADFSVELSERILSKSGVAKDLS